MDPITAISLVLLICAACGWSYCVGKWMGVVTEILKDHEERLGKLRCERTGEAADAGE